MEDDFDEWSGDDIKKLKELRGAMREKGFEQGDDDRGSNYVRLQNGNLAMIDFESFIALS